MVDRKSKTLTQLENHDWGPPAYDSQLVQTIHQLRYKPIEHSTDGDLRICIGQNLGLRFLVPLALARVESEPLLDASIYPGDLLVTLLRADREFWSRQTDLAKRLLSVAEQISHIAEESNVQNAIAAFAQSCGWPT